MYSGGISLQTNPANVERIVDRQTDPPPELATKTKARQTTNSFDTYYDPSNTLRQGGRGDVFYKVVWQGRFVEASWYGTISATRIAHPHVVITGVAHMSVPHLAPLFLVAQQGHARYAPTDCSDEGNGVRVRGQSC
eukprot:COSAG02_NODE_1426_length_12664_cov_6.226980_3_plen_136_part_00